jgi:hypothetical protein
MRTSKIEGDFHGEKGHGQWREIRTIFNVSLGCSGKIDFIDLNLGCLDNEVYLWLINSI